MTDGASNSLLVVEITASGIHWMEPRDLQFDKLPLKINLGGASGISSQHGEGVHALFGDGRVDYLPNSLPEKTLRLLLEINDGEPTPDF
jgi:prepilin-type processing-associated H-X9-DG protein